MTLPLSLANISQLHYDNMIKIDPHLGQLYFLQGIFKIFGISFLHFWQKQSMRILLSGVISPISFLTVFSVIIALFGLVMNKTSL